MCNIKPTLGGSKLEQIQKFDQGIFLLYVPEKYLCCKSWLTNNFICRRHFNIWKLDI